MCDLRSSLTAIALAFLVVVPTRAYAAARLEGIPDEIRGGECLEIRWSGLEDDVYEVELEISLAGARWVRISPEIEALAGHYTWRVPQGLAGPARIRLRAGGGEEGERDVAEQSCSFVSTAPSGPAASRSTPGWWDVGSPEGPGPSGLFSAHRPAMSAESGCAEAAPVPSSAADRNTTTERSNTRRERSPHAPSVAARTFMAPRLSPLRN